MARIDDFRWVNVGGKKHSVKTHCKVCGAQTKHGFVLCKTHFIQTINKRDVSFEKIKTKYLVRRNRVVKPKPLSDLEIENERLRLLSLKVKENIAKKRERNDL